jgi:hypothetical protein
MRCVPLAGQGKLEAAWDRLDDNVFPLDFIVFRDLVDGAFDERIDDGFVPPRVHDCDP